MLSRPYYLPVRMGRYIAALIDTVNRGDTLQNLVKPEGRMRETLDLYRRGLPFAPAASD
jgi:ribose-phosphate pyrophosphokinase